MLIILPNHTNTIVLGKGAKTSKIAPLEDETEQEAIRYDPRAAELPPIARVTTPSETPRYDEVFAEEVLPPLTSSPLEDWHRVRDEGDAFIKSEARALGDDGELDDDIQEALGLPEYGFQDFKRFINDLTYLNKELAQLHRMMEPAKDRAGEIDNRLPIDELEERIKDVEEKKEQVIVQLRSWEDIFDLSYDELVEEMDAEPEAYSTYKVKN